MKKIKQNRHLNIALIGLIIWSIMAFIGCPTLCLIHMRWVNNGIQITGSYENDYVTYFSATDMDYITVEAPYQSELLEGKKVIIYYNANDPQSCYIYDQIKLGLAFGILSFVFVIGALTIHLIIRRRTIIYTEIIMNGQSTICDISEIEIIEDSNNVEYAIIHAKYSDPLTNKEYSFESQKIKDKDLIKEPNVTGTVQVHFLKENPEQYVITAYQINQN